MGLPERAIRATTCTFCPAENARPGTMESAGVNSTVWGNRLASRFAASGGPGWPGSRTNTKSGAASGADFDNRGESSIWTRTAAPLDPEVDVDAVVGPAAALGAA